MSEKLKDGKEPVQDQQCSAMNTNLLGVRDQNIERLRDQLTTVLNRGRDRMTTLHPVQVIEVVGGTDKNMRARRRGILMMAYQSACFEAFAEDPRSGFRGTNGEIPFVFRALDTTEGNILLVICENGTLTTTHQENKSSMRQELNISAAGKLKMAGYGGLVPKGI